MVAAIIFGLHGLVAVVLFVSRKKKAGIGEGFLAVGLFGILFSVGWTILTMIAKVLIPPEGFAIWLNRDAVTLCALTVVEVAAYLIFRPRKGEKEETSTPA